MLAKLRAVVPDGVRVGVTDTAAFLETAHELRSRVEAGLHGGLGFTYGVPEQSTTPMQSFPWARSIVVVAVPYLREGDGAVSTRHVARFADGDRYAEVRTVLTQLESVLRSFGHRTEQVYDSDQLVDRAVAVRAGVAWNGKSTMAITPGHGPWFLIGSVVTDATLEPTAPMTRTCGTCTACIPACPTDAIVAPGVLDASRCLSAVLQRPGPIPLALRSAVGGRIYGCDDCLVACPPGHEALDSVSGAEPTLTPGQVLAMADAELAAIVSAWYVPRRNMRFVRRNALVAIGNTGAPEAVAVVAGYLGHPDRLLRCHAAWALGRLGGKHADAALVGARDAELDAAVIVEIDDALAR